MNTRLFLIFYLLLGCTFAQTQIVAGEWFLDTDPGFGQGMAFNPFTSDTLIMADVQFAISTLPSGVHRWHARVKDDQDRWSHTYARTFMVLPRDTVASMAKLEWFWDTDPGYGQGNAISLSGDIDTASWNLDLNNLSPGIHDLYVRVSDAEGIWGHTEKRNTFVRAEPKAMIEKLTYYYRSPGDTTGTFTYTLNEPQHYIDLSFNPDANDLTAGQDYEFCITIVRTDSQMSFEQCQLFTWTEPVGIDKQATQIPFVVFPNPNNGAFQVELPEDRPGIAHFQLFDASGKSVYMKQVRQADHFRFHVEITNPVSGVYFAVVEIGTSVSVQRLIII